MSLQLSAAKLLKKNDICKKNCKIIVPQDKKNVKKCHFCDKTKGGNLEI